MCQQQEKITKHKISKFDEGGSLLSLRCRMAFFSKDIIFIKNHVNKLMYYNEGIFSQFLFNMISVSELVDSGF